MEEQEIEKLLKMKPIVIELSPEAFAHFIEVCENPPEPTEALKKLFR